MNENFWSIESCEDTAHPGWLTLRLLIWPDESKEGHLDEMAEQSSRPDKFCQFIARDTLGFPIGLAEASVRTEYVNGTNTSPVAFLEGLFVVEEYRQQGVARSLVEAVEGWAKLVGCTELASDAPLQNLVSLKVHARLGFQETERVVCFCRVLPNDA
jgi:aminoglycoside 6'-N-acetyltransferase I